ncbi:MAG: hypothetical protein H7242_13560 [Microbacteriaceae bacterium]|nr:hypothetical protein [Burkholderiaceae bacterium]
MPTPFGRAALRVALHLTSDETDEVLNFGFDLLEDVLEAEDGDGTWDDALEPSSSRKEALAGYLGLR